MLKTPALPDRSEPLVMRRAQIAIAVMVLMVMAPVARAACPDFAAAVNYGAGSIPQSVATGDFNGDGRPDLAIASSTSNSLSILLGNSDGTFAAAGPNYATGGGSPTSIAAGDFDGDGKLDLAVVNFSSNTVAILRGDGLGGLGTATSFATGSGPMFVAAADFDRNGVLDLAVANASSNNVSILIGTGSGGFGTATNFPVGTYPQSIAIGDFDADGKLDLAVANHNSDNVSVLLGNGSGSFGTAVSFSIPATAPALAAGPTSITTADVNGDGRLDLAVANDTSRTVAIRLGIGAGSFGTATTFAVGTDPHAVVAGDFNGDGRVDLAVANYNSNTISILVGSGSGTFTAGIVSPATGTHPTALAMGDFNGDGKPDLASANYNGNNVSILLNSGACFVNCATFSAATNFGSNFGGSMGGTSVAAGDFNRDAAPDLAVVSGSHVSVLLGSGTGSFSLPTDYALGSTPVGVVIADFNGDGKLDLAVVIDANFASVSFMLGDGSGGFGAVTPVGIPATESGAEAIAIGDFNRDGRPDVAVTSGVSQGMTILLNTTAAGAGTPTFTPSSIFPVASYQRGVATGDFNRDGKLDLAVAIYGNGTNPGSVVILLGNGSGGFTAGATLTTGIGTRAVVIGDFNRDGKLDLAVSNYVSNNVSILLGDGAGAFASTPTVAAGTNPSAIAAGDFDNDGRLDLAVIDATNLSMLRGDGSGGLTAASPATYSVVYTPLAVGAADLNRDGKLDLFVANSNSNANVSVLLNSCPGPDLTVTKNHIGGFSQGSTGGYTIYVNNIAAISSSGTVTLIDTLPAGLTATDISGNGWTCILGTLTCRRSDPLSGGNSSYPAIGISVNVASNAPASITNTATVSGGSEANLANDTGSDPTTVSQFPDITLTKTHTGIFSQGQTGASYTITVSNIGGTASSGPVTMTDTLPAGLTATAISGTGWTCTLGTRSCTRSNSLASGASYSPITLTVNVASNAAATLINSATVISGSQFYTANDTVTDPTTIIQVPDLTITKTHLGNFRQGQTSKSYSIAVRNIGGAASSGTVSVADTLPTGLTATAIFGNGWSCTLGTLTCTRSDVLGAGSSYPAITLTVNVASNAPASLTNSATVSGGGEINTANDIASDPTTVNPGGPYCGTFAPAVDYYPGFNSSLTSLAIGDFDASGTADLAVADNSSNKVSILTGNSNGTFAVTVSYDVGTSPYSVATADLNGDGALDLALANSSSNNVSVLLGNGNGTFVAAVNYPVGASPMSVAIGDFNGDGKLDLAVANQNGGTVSILMGNGNGTFVAAVNYAAGPSPISVATGDFNGDGTLDLAVANQSNYIVSILVGNGNGTFAAKVDYAANLLPNSVAVGDFNADGKQDLAVTNQLADNVSILMGNGDATFATAVHYAVGITPRSVAIGDFNGDGKQDLAVANDVSNSASILLGNGNGTFAAAVSYIAGTGPSFVAAGDFNGDGRPDLAVANFTSRMVSILLSACADLTISKSHTGSFTQGQTNVSYTLTASNLGPVATSGTITVTDALPTGLTATAIDGAGWACILGTLTCTRSDSIAAGSSPAFITVTVSVNSNAAASVTNSASVSGGGDLNTANNTASDPTTVNPSGLIAPTRLVATATSTSQIGVVWDPVTTAVSYQLYRSSNNGPFVLVASPSVAAFPDSGLNGSTTYVYQVKAVNATIALSPPSNNDMATTIIFTDDPIVAGTTVIKAIHLAELRTAVNAVRVAAGFAPAAFTDPSTAGVLIKAVHVNELRSNLAAARSALGLPAMVYTDPSLTAGSTIKAAHIREIRRGTRPVLAPE